MARLLPLASLFVTLVIFGMIVLVVWSLVPYDRGDSRCGVAYAIVASDRYDHGHDCWPEAKRRSLLGTGGLFGLVVVGVAGAALARPDAGAGR